LQIRGHEGRTVTSSALLLDILTPVALQVYLLLVSLRWLRYSDLTGLGW